VQQRRLEGGAVRGQDWTGPIHRGVRWKEREVRGRQLVVQGEDGEHQMGVGDVSLAEPNRQPYRLHFQSRCRRLGPEQLPPQLTNP
jgi:hypothetical protein